MTSLRETYRIVALTRDSYDVLRTGDVTTLLADDASLIYAYARTDTNGPPTCALAVFNRATVPHTATLTVPNVCSNTVYYDVLHSDAPYTATGTSLDPIPLSALSGAVLVPRFDNPNTPDTVPSLPPAEVTIQAASTALTLSEQTRISATVRDVAGVPLPAGVTVDFNIVDGGGSLSGAAVTNADGVAVVTYTAPATESVAVVQAAIRAPSGIRYQANTSLFVGYKATVSEMKTTQTGIGPQTVALSGVMTVTKQGRGEPVLTLARLDDVPNAQHAASEYVDLHLSNVTNVDFLTVTLPYTDSGSEDLPTFFWWHNGAWSAVSGTVLCDAGLASFRVTTGSTPSLSQLTGTPLVVAYEANAPAVIHVAQAQAARFPWSWPVALLLGGLLFLERRRLLG